MKSNPWQIHPNETPFISPDGKKEFQYTHAEEIRMGSPLSGTCIIKIKKQIYKLPGIYGCPPVWSDCSKYLALPYWNADYSQKIAVVYIENKEIRLSAENYRVLEFKKFENGILKGVDSPIHKTETLEIELSKLQFSRRIKLQQ